KEAASCILKNAAIKYCLNFFFQFFRGHKIY
ncbi:hypothetical protein, partial [Plasmodium yoelii yoelii]